MGHVDQGSYCSICGQYRSGRTRRAQHDREFLEHICSRRTCAEVKRQLRKASKISGSVGSLIIEVHHYYHTSRPNEASFDRTHIYSSELHAESLSQNREMLRDRGGPPSVDPLTKPSEDVVRQCLGNGTR